ncbi:MAG: hypothetical protein AAF970_01715 [Bacteroidota bacterium]
MPLRLLVLTVLLLLVAAFQAMPDADPPPRYLAILEGNAPSVAVFDLERKTLHARVALPDDLMPYQSLLWVGDTLYTRERRLDGSTGTRYIDLLRLDAEAGRFVRAYSLPGDQADHLAVSRDHQRAALVVADDYRSGQFNPYLIVALSAPGFDTTQVGHLTTYAHPHRYEMLKETADTLLYAQWRIRPSSTYMTPSGSLLMTVGAYEQVRRQETRSNDGTVLTIGSNGYDIGEKHIIVGYDLALGRLTLADSVGGPHGRPRFVASPDERFLYYLAQTAPRGGYELELRQFDREREQLRALYQAPMPMMIQTLIEADERSVLGYYGEEGLTHFVRVDTTGAVVQYDTVPGPLNEIRRLDEHHYLAISVPPFTVPMDFDAEIDHFMVHYIQDDPIGLVRTDTIRFDPLPRLWWGTHGTTPAPTR